VPKQQIVAKLAETKRTAGTKFKTNYQAAMTATASSSEVEVAASVNAVMVAVTATS